MATRTKSANANTPSLSPTAAIVVVLVLLREVGKKIEGAGDKDRALGTRVLTPARERLGGVVGVLDMSEVRFGAGREFLCRQGAIVGRGRGDERVAEGR